LNTKVYAVVFDGTCDQELVDVAEKSQVQHIVSMDSQVRDARVNVVTAAQL
jgi:hypothetical protein